MAPHAAVGIDDDFAPGQTAIALRPADHEAAGGIDMIDRVFVEILGWNHRLDDAVDDGFPQLVVIHIGAMLGRDDDVFDFDRLAVAVLHRDLRFAVGTEKVSFAAFANFG
jgi:hypothetical protein